MATKSVLNRVKRAKKEIDHAISTLIGCDQEDLVKQLKLLSSQFEDRIDDLEDEVE